MTDAETIDEIIAASKEARRKLAELEQELQDEINEINFTAFIAEREVTAEEGARRKARRATQLEVREAYVSLAYETLKELDESPEIARLQAKMANINSGLQDDLDHLKAIERYAGTVAKVVEEFAKIAEKAADLAS